MKGERPQEVRSERGLGWAGGGPGCSTEELRGRQGSITDSLQPSAPTFSFNPLSLS